MSNITIIRLWIIRDFGSDAVFPGTNAPARR